MTPGVTIVGSVTAAGFRVRESYFHIGRRVMDRKRWLEVRQLPHHSRSTEEA